jgi:hypothetical protein
VEGCPQRLTPLRTSAVVRILIPFTSDSHLHPLDSAQEPTKEREIRKVNVKKVLLAASVALVVLVGAGVAYASSNNASEKEADESYKGSVSVAGENESSMQKLAKIDEAAAQQAALDAVPRAQYDEVAFIVEGVGGMPPGGMSASRPLTGPSSTAFAPHHVAAPDGDERCQTPLDALPVH